MARSAPAIDAALRLRLRYRLVNHSREPGCRRSNALADCRALICLLLSIGIAIAVTRPASAHPHVFIDNVVTFVFSGDEITGLRLLWTFDEVFSEAFLQDFDSDGDGGFSPAEVAEIKKNSLASLKEYGYFTHLWIDGQPVGGFEATDLMVTREGGSVIYDMRITLAKPINPRAARIEAAVYDDSYYIEVALHQPVRFEGVRDGRCTYKVTEDESRAYYYETVYPETIELTCRTS